MSVKEQLDRKNIVILDGGRRTPRADILLNNNYPGLMSRYSTNKLGSIVIEAAMKASKVIPDEIGHVIMGNALESHRDSIYGARGMALGAGLNITTPALTVRRLCGSGAQSIVNGTQMLLLGDHPEDQPFMVVGGAESMQYPHILYNLRGRKQGNTTVKYGAVACSSLPPGSYAQDLLHMALFDPSAGMAMANTAEKLGRNYKITRLQADTFAYNSQKKAHLATTNGWFEEEITPVTVVDQNGEESSLRSDTHIRPNISMDALLDLPPVFEPPNGIITPGNASAVVDGAAAMVICGMETAKARGLQPLCRIAGWGYAGVDPTLMGIGPAPATENALKMAGLSGDQIDTLELNEAFAPQALACIHEFKKMGIDPEKVNPVGNAIAMGHPLGATGSILTLTAAYHLKRNHLRYGLITMCIGGGQGIALIIENMQL